MGCRPMDFAGSWYPATPRACEQKILEFISTPLAEDSPRGRYGIAPHAGWVFSGPLAGRVFQAFPVGAEIGLVVVLGGHLGRGDPVVAMTEGEWETPFGPFPIHSGFRSDLDELGGVEFETEQRYRPDNSTELQLPFAKFRFPEAQLLPIRVPPSSLAIQLGRRLAAYLARSGLRAVVVASTDLTHYGPNYHFEPRGRGEEALRWVREENDPAFIRAVEGGEGEAILSTVHRCSNACSAGAVVALNEVARAEGLRFQPLAYGTSADTGPRDKRNFVGYLAGVYC
ncbi:MAG: AmmeMemoRadiSam system protein B [SAR324 cluster bacterium]|nr:AmmeMemoRadiSam system protein B [SAR324 cluster bacterium]